MNRIAILTDEQIVSAHRAIDARILSKGVFTFSQIWPAASRAVGTTLDANDPCYRLADRYLQRLRKGGFIGLDPKNKRRWIVTDAGRRALYSTEDRP